ncbi:enolase C-terminal domain-like protein [Ilumatobacter nonamiensis]|uniref:enolase C-terminal domain-like protein n=1 Tax=Ilumatobacter nonamiensis TaxID=467093 RepID=UPI00034AA45B|nr:enolase C-terminal domain-like protein [Ilumatobacter nonamiensis]
MQGWTRWRASRAARAARSPSSQVTIAEARVLAYRMPLRKAFGTARGLTSRSQNFLVWFVIRDEAGNEYEGVGEGQPRWTLTGDSLDQSWSFLVAAAETVVDDVLDISGRTEAVASVRRTMHRLHELAEAHASAELGTRPFRGTLLGLEVALLDAVARALGIPLHELLGTRRPTVIITADTLSTTSAVNLDDELLQKLRSRAQKFGAARLKGFGDVERDVELMRTIGQLVREAGPDNLLWIDENGELADDEAVEFTDRLVDLIRAGVLPRRVVVEQPVSSTSELLPVLQRRADNALDGGGDLRIMADERIWDIADFGPVVEDHGCRAINIKIPKAGGLLAALDLAEAASASDDVEVYIGGMLGTSDVTTWTLVHLGMAMARVDYMTAVPPAQVEARIATPLARYEERSKQLARPVGAGLGTIVDRVALFPYVTRERSFPSPPSLVLRGVPANDFSAEADVLRRFGRVELDSHVLEREGLMRGLGSHRRSPIDVAVNDRSGLETTFSWSKSSITSRSAVAITGDKESTRTFLSLAGVPTPVGRVFAVGDATSAAGFASAIGFPVVVKPVAGTGGVGVVTNLRSGAEVRGAFSAATGSKAAADGLIVERHVSGGSFRLFVIGGEVVSAIRWRGSELIGDGRSSVVELAGVRNEFRRSNPHLMNRLIKFDAVARGVLDRQGLGLDSVPAAGRSVPLTIHPQGGETEEVVHELHPSIRDTAVRAVEAVPGLAFSGIDMIIEDHRRPIDSQSSAVVEVNGHPALTSAEYPVHGPRHAIVGRIVEETVARGGLDAAPRSDGDIAMSVTVRGFFVGQRYERWFSERASELGLGVRNLRVRDGRLRATVEGLCSRVAVLSSLAIVGPSGATPTRVSTQPLARSAGGVS